MTTLKIEIDLDKFGPLEELDSCVWESELDYWVEFLYADPPQFFDGATFTLVIDDQKRA